MRQRDFRNAGWIGYRESIARRGAYARDGDDMVAYVSISPADGKLTLLNRT